MGRQNPGLLQRMRWMIYVIITLKIKDRYMEELITKLKQQIIEELLLEDLTADDIDEDLPLFGDGLGLDSIDALSLVVVLDRDYGIKIENPEDGKEVLQSVKTIAEYIQANRT